MWAIPRQASVLVLRSFEVLIIAPYQLILRLISDIYKVHDNDTELLRL